MNLDLQNLQVILKITCKDVMVKLKINNKCNDNYVHTCCDYD